MHCLQYETRVPVILISVQNFHVLPFSLPFQIHPALSVFVSYKTTYQSSIRRKAKFPNPFLFLLVYVSTSRRVERKKKKNRNNEGRGLDIFSKASVPSSGLSMHLIQVTRSSRPFVEKNRRETEYRPPPPPPSIQRVRPWLLFCIDYREGRRVGPSLYANYTECV